MLICKYIYSYILYIYTYMSYIVILWTLYVLSLIKDEYAEEYIIYIHMPCKVEEVLSKVRCMFTV